MCPSRLRLLRYGPPGILAVMRSRKDYTWITILGLRAIEVCLRPRTSAQPAFLRSCDPVAFSIQMLEMEMIDEVFMLMKKCSHLKGVRLFHTLLVATLTRRGPVSVSLWLGEAPSVCKFGRSCYEVSMTLPCQCQCLCPVLRPCLPVCVSVCFDNFHDCNLSILPSPPLGNHFQSHEQCRG